MARVRRLVPAFILLVGLIASIAAALALARAEEGRRDARFNGLAASAVGAIETRMLAQLTLLRGAAGFFNAEDDVTRADFRAYVERLRLDHHYPGVLGVAFSAHARDRAELDRIVAQTRAEGMAGFRHWPEGQRPDYSAIVYIEPLNRRNRQALGFDMLSESVRREAMEGARQSAVARLSGRVQLVQEIDPVKQPGFLIYVPLYRGGQDGADGRRLGELYGWVYSPLRAYDLLGAIFRERDLTDLAVEVFDQRVDEDRLLYRSGEVQERPGHALVRYVDIAGRTWAVRTTSTPAFDAESPFAPATTVAVAGILITLLIAALTWQQIRAATLIEHQIERRTAELRETNERLIAEARAREEAEAQVRQMQKMEAIGQLTGGIAHDFNNMLAVIIGNLDLAQRRADDPGRVRRGVDHAKEAAVRAAELTQRLLAFGRQQALAPRPLDSNALLYGMEDLLRRTLGEAIRLEIQLGDGLWRTYADAAQLENAILNLAINARDAMPDGGTLTIATGNCARRESSEDSAAAGEFVRIAIADTGRGMSPEVAAKAVDPFFTTKEVGRGSGLGLSQVYGFVRQSGGQLEIQSEEGKGTSVGILLPRYSGGDRLAEPAVRQDEEMPTGRPEEVVLVVEDEAQVRDVSVETLRELGYTVLAASGGAEALATLDRRSDVNLLFTDVVMPEMNGRRLADEAKARRRDLKLLFTTGYTRDAIVRHGRLEEGVELIHKPFTAAELARKVRDALDSQD